MRVGRRLDQLGAIRVIGSAVAALLVVLALALPAVASSGPTRLSDPSHSPGSGTTATTFTMAVTYRSLNQTPADRVRVKIGGRTYDMTRTGPIDWKHGVRFSWSGRLPAGTLAIVFESRSRDRFDSTLSGGSVVVKKIQPAPEATPKPTPAPTPKPAGAPKPPAPTPKPLTEPTTTPAASPVDQPNSWPRGEPTFEPAPGGPLPSPTPTGDPVTAVIGGTTGAGGAGPGGSGGGPGSAAGGGGSGSGPDGSAQAWGPLSNAMTALGIDGPALPPIGLAPALVTTTGAVATWMAFGVFGRRRRDGEPPAPDEVLAAEAALGVNVAIAGLTSDRPGPQHNSGAGRLPGPAGAAVPGPNEGESALPRWRRPSLLEARKADPIRDVTAPARLSFDRGLVGPLDGRERRLIRYNVVRLLDVPDELRGVEIGFLDEGDEVQLLERHGTYWLVLCPNGGQGWIHKMTLGDIVMDDDAPGANGATATMPTTPDTWTMGDIDDDVLTAYIASRRREA